MPFGSFGWAAWSILLALSVGLLLVIGRVEGWLRPDPVAAPAQQEPAPSTPSAYLLDGLRILTMLLAMLAAWLLPPFQVVRPLLALDLGLLCALLIAVLAITPQLHRSVEALRWRARVHFFLHARGGFKASSVFAMKTRSNPRSRRRSTSVYPSPA